MDDTTQAAKAIEQALVKFAHKCVKESSNLITIKKPLCVVERAIQEGTPKLIRLQGMTLMYGMLVHLTKLGLEPVAAAAMVCDSVQLWVGESHEVLMSIEAHKE